MSGKPTLPQSGGSYVRGEDGALLPAQKSAPKPKPKGGVKAPLKTPLKGAENG